MTCIKCGKEITGEGIAFCPYCGAKLETAEKKPVSKEAEEWVQKAQKVTSLPERKKILSGLDGDRLGTAFYRHAGSETGPGKAGFFHHQELAAPDLPETRRLFQGETGRHAPGTV